MIRTTPIGNAYTFSGTVFGWLYSRLVSPLTWQSRPLLVLLNAGRCECLWLDLALLLFSREGFGELSDDNSSSARVSMLLGMMSLFSLS